MAILSIPITKGGEALSVDLDNLPDAMYKLALKKGLALILNSRMTKAGPSKDADEKTLADTKTKAMSIARENLEKLMAGDIKEGRGATSSSTKTPAIVMTEAIRQAKEVVKDTIRAAGEKISHYKAAQITAAAKELIASEDSTSPDSFISKATVTIEARTAKIVKAPEGDTEAATKAKAEAAAKLASLGNIAPDPKLIAKDNAAKAERAKNKPLSAKQAGKVAPRKGTAPTVSPSA